MADLDAAPDTQEFNESITITKFEKVKAILICNEVVRERVRQFAKFGYQDLTLSEFITVLGEEYGEVCRAALDSRPPQTQESYLAHLEHYREEMIQVAAVAVQAIEVLDDQIEKEFGIKRKTNH